MGVQSKFYKSAFKTLQERKQISEDKAIAKKNKIYKDIPELLEIDNQLSKNMVIVARYALSEGSKQKIEEISKISLELSNRKRQLLSMNNINETDLKVQYFCNNCSDTGYDKNGKVCSCVKSLAKQFAFKELNSSTPLNNCTFENFDCNRYSDDNREVMTTIFDFCKNYADEFNENSQSLLFMGGTGLGKTHLSLSIAGKVIEKGYGVIYGPLSKILAKIEKEHFSQSDSTTLDNICDCDLLIIDDLGTEFLTSFTTSVLYDIINTRILNSKPIIISTNLSVEELEKQYGQRIISRIFGCYKGFVFRGEDIRLD